MQLLLLCKRKKTRECSFGCLGSLTVTLFIIIGFYLYRFYYLRYYYNCYYCRYTAMRTEIFIFISRPHV